MEDIIWITYKGRRIPIKPGLKGKFNKKNLEETKKKKEAMNYMEEQYKAFDKGDISSKELEQAKIDSGLSKKEIEEARDYTNARAKEDNSRISENKSGKTTSQPVPNKELEDQVKRRIWAEKTLNEQYNYSDRQGKKELTNNFNKELRKQNELEKKYGKISENDFKKMQSDIYKKASLNTLSDYEQYFINQGYSKATALKKAKEIIAQRKRK